MKQGFNNGGQIPAYGNEKQAIPCSESELRELWKAGQQYWRTSGATITFEEWLEQLKTKKGLNIATCKI
jgi:hypothetical protein